jgi:hypothetical protein
MESILQTIDTPCRGKRIRLEQLQNGGWRYVIEDRLQSDKTYRSAGDAESDAIDVVLILDNRGRMTADEFRGVIAALDTSLLTGFEAVDADERDS